MNVDKAAMRDVAALVDMRLQYLREDHGGLDAEAEADIKRALPGYFRAHLGRDLFAYVIRDGDSIVSCAFLLTVEKPMSPAFPNGKTGIVMNVYTRPSHRRRGFAGRIMAALTDAARAMDLSVVELKATQDGYPLYRKAGFHDDQSKYRPMRWENRRDR
ncbi:MAG: GNAT family N-acetyltransferase [Clostridia bacterium]|nr:GNAT family N-acetyltransferase [Clostridia bacterium]